MCMYMYSHVHMYCIGNPHMHMHTHKIRDRSPLLVTFVHIPAWYLFYDFFAMFDAFTLRKNLKHLSLGNQFFQYIKKKSGLVCHHIILFLGGYIFVAVCVKVTKCFILWEQYNTVMSLVLQSCENVMNDNVNCVRVYQLMWYSFD